MQSGPGPNVVIADLNGVRPYIGKTIGPFGLGAQWSKAIEKDQQRVNGISQCVKQCQQEIKDNRMSEITELASGFELKMDENKAKNQWRRQFCRLILAQEINNKCKHLEIYDTMNIKKSEKIT